MEDTSAPDRPAAWVVAVKAAGRTAEWVNAGISGDDAVMSNAEAGAEAGAGAGAAGIMPGCIMGVNGILKPGVLPIAVAVSYAENGNEDWAGTGEPCFGWPEVPDGRLS